MSRRAIVNAPHNQKGVVLLVLVMVMVLAFVSYTLSDLSINQVKTDQKTETQVALKKAKKALIAYAVSNWEVTGNAGKLGKLPCPDYTDTALEEGEQDSNCGNAYANGIGYFPWRTLGVEPPKDGSGSCLIYAVSPAYKTTPAAALNPDSYGQLQTVDEAGASLQGGLPEDRLVAVIIAPEEPLSGQARNNAANTICGLDYGNISAYLDNDGTTNNAAIVTSVDNTIDKFVQKYSKAEGVNALNDRLITISYGEFWAALQSTITGVEFDARMKNLTEALAICFSRYGISNGNHLPMPALLGLGGGEYRKDVDYDDSGVFTTNYAGRLPYDISNSNTKLINSDANHIFDNAYCDGIDLNSTATVENIRFTDDAGSDNGEYLDLWSNWKDHFFYVVSNANNPATAVAACSGNCISISDSGTEYAGMIIFSGLKLGADRRYSPPFDATQALDSVDDKDDVVNYLENGNDTLFPDVGGNGSYSLVDPDPLISNDVMFCINTDMSVVECL